MALPLGHVIKKKRSAERFANSASEGATFCSAPTVRKLSPGDGRTGV